MDEIRATDVADTAGMLGVGLGIIAMPFLPFALPLLILVIGPLALLALPLLVLAAPLLLPLLVIRAIRRRRRAHPHGPRPDAFSSKHVLRPGVLG
jgi:hypothetical protein